MNTHPKISIVIPSYNKAQYIGQTLDSIAAQKYPNLEIIIQDGGSTDGSVEIIQEFAKRNPGQVLWVSQPDGGQLDAINQGLKKATGDLVAEIDGDDLYQAGTFFKVAEKFSAHPDALWLVGKGDVIDHHGKAAFSPVTVYKNMLLRLNRFSLLLAVNYIVQPAVFFRREAFERFGFFEGNRNFVLEYDLWLKLGREQMPVVVNETLASYRLTLGTISSTQSAALLKEDYLAAKKHTRNPLILLLHQAHNVGRLGIISLLKARR